MSHSIELSLNDEGIHAEFRCDAGEDDNCHQVCAFGCEIFDDYCVTHHPREQVDYCNPVTFMIEGGDWYESYIGEETEPRSGPITFEWTSSDWYGWRYEDEVPEDADPQLNTAAETTTRK